MDVIAGFEHCIRENEPLGPYTWLRIGGPAQYYAEPTRLEELQAIVKACHKHDVPVRLLGGGSNLLVPSQGVAGMVVSIDAPAFGQIRVAGNEISSGGGAKLAHLISSAVRDGLAGLEPLVGIPGTVGGALHGNTGSHGADIGQWCVAATVMTRAGDVLKREAHELRFSYRKSSLDELVILDATFRLEPEDSETLTRRMQKTWILRRANQPSIELGSACIFRDPHGMTAAELLDQVGMKGTRVGGAEVCDRNPNFIVAQQGATSEDVARLIDMMRGRIASELGVDLELQIEIW